MFADIAVPLPLFQTFRYAVSPSIGLVVPGSRVLVPFGARHLIGVVVRMRRKPRTGRTRAVERLLEKKPILSPQLLQLGLWVSSYYMAPPGETLRTMLPPGLLARKVSLDEGRVVGRFWPVKKQLSIVEVESAGDRLTAKQSHVLAHLSKRTLPLPVQHLLKEIRISRSVIQSLAFKGAIRLESVETYRSPWGLSEIVENPDKHQLTSEQMGIYKKIRTLLAQSGFRRMLIHGVTGSGKTEIYLNAIEHALSLGKSALVLVPEIGLTPQISGYFRAWFGERVAILHSGLSKGERFDQWRRIREGEAPVVVGTRSAIFAPLFDLGLIIVDEEHDGSYKQEDLPRYHARDVALKRGQIEGLLVILGSATPQLETYHHSFEKGEPQYEVLRSRILERPLPTIHVVDMRHEFQKRGKASILSEVLESGMRQRLNRQEQTLILLNRRGFASALLCRSCGHTERCQNCSISLTYHQKKNRLMCHYCGYVTDVPRCCSACEKEYIYFLGEGTEKLQGILRQMFPKAVIDRLDRDTVRTKGSLEKILEDLSSGQTDILIGTQMIAKGHDFPQVTLVGVLSAEQQLRLEDFRAAERTFQLLTQVAGRAGRGEKPGEVIIQTYFPNHYSLRFACEQDYRGFYEDEIRFRRNFQYPPYTALASLLHHGPDRDKVWQLAEETGRLLVHRREELSSDRRMRILGPAPAAIEKLKGAYRVQFLIKTTSRKELHAVLEAILNDLQERNVDLTQVSIDIDPVSLL